MCKDWYGALGHLAGFSAESIADRNQDAGAKLMVTADGLYRRGKVLALKETVDEALAKSPTVNASS